MKPVVKVLLVGLGLVKREVGKLAADAGINDADCIASDQHVAAALTRQHCLR